ncbi:hypothetical protein H0H81_005848 [Sphagnurus paluster]|uniref:Uncharacterized protein n=1 Tax=Sphagnurus paluster TaxID=117069 RepID=A0A9P7K4Y6_9AGAR|nr:hypothetical protein H0H81_005848 [Sphagnurus paluster]
MSEPPRIEEKILPSTSAHEWATVTTSSLHHATTSTTSTPGPDFPGAFPRNTEEENDSVDIIAAAKEYIPSQETIKDAVVAVAGTAKQYLPTSVASYFLAPAASRGSDIDPTRSGQEPSLQQVKGEDHGSFAARVPNATGVDTSFLTPHTNGNLDDNSFDSSNISTQTVNGSVTPGSLSSAPSSARDAYTGFIGSSTPDDTDSHVKELLSSADTLSATGGLSPVVDEESSRQQNGAARSGGRIKDAQSAVANTEARTHPLGGPGAVWKGVPLEESYQRALDDKSEMNTKIGTGENTMTTNAGYQNLGKTAIVSKNETQAEKSTERPATANGTSGPERPAVDQPSASPIDKTTESSGPTGDNMPLQTSKIKSVNPDGKDGSPHKSTFMEKIKGEVKVISGKLAHNESKVEEGRRLLGKVA